MSTETSALELRQTREFSASEQRDLLDLWRKLEWPDGGGRWFNTIWYSHYTFAGFLAISIVQIVYELSWMGSSLSLQLALAAIGFAVTFVLLQWVTARVWQKMYWRAASSQTRFVIEADGLRGIGANGDALLRWHGIGQPVHTDRFIAVGGKGRWVLLAKAAFTGQDVDGFCAELARRWHAAKAQAA